MPSFVTRLGLALFWTTQGYRDTSGSSSKISRFDSVLPLNTYLFEVHTVFDETVAPPPCATKKGNVPNGRSTEFHNCVRSAMPRILPCQHYLLSNVRSYHSFVQHSPLRDKHNDSKHNTTSHHERCSTLLFGCYRSGKGDNRYECRCQGCCIKGDSGGKDRIVVLGGGWAGFQIALNANKDLPLTVVSPNNHFVFTPLLASTAVGTLEFRCIQEPIRTVLGPKGQFIQAKARWLDPDKKCISCESVHGDSFELEYDKLVIAVGVQTNASCSLGSNRIVTSHYG